MLQCTAAVPIAAWTSSSMQCSDSLVVTDALVYHLACMPHRDGMNSLDSQLAENQPVQTGSQVAHLFMLLILQYLKLMLVDLPAATLSGSFQEVQHALCMSLYRGILLQVWPAQQFPTMFSSHLMHSLFLLPLLHFCPELRTGTAVFLVAHSDSRSIISTSSRCSIPMLPSVNLLLVAVCTIRQQGMSLQRQPAASYISAFQLIS